MLSDKTQYLVDMRSLNLIEIVLSLSDDFENEVIRPGRKTE